MTTLAASGYIADNARTEGEHKQFLEDLRSVISELMGGSMETTLTIAAGVANPTGAIHAIDTEAAAATDDLKNIDQTIHPDGRTLLIRAADAGRVVTIVHGAGGTGQIILLNGANINLNEVGWLLLKRTGTLWEQMIRSPMSAATPGTVVLRDANGRAKVANPAASQDALNLGAADGRYAVLANNLADIPNDAAARSNIGAKSATEPGTGGETLRVIRGRVDSLGSIIDGTGFAVVKNGTGSYTVTYSTAFSGIPSVAISPHRAGTYFYPSTEAASSFGVGFGNTTDNLVVDSGFDFIATGPI